MSRVTQSTLRAAAVAALVATTFAVSACGSDSEGNADAPTTSPAATTPTTPDTSEPGPTPAPMPAVIDSPVSVTDEGKRAIDSASDRAISRSAMDAKVKKIMTALDKAGYDSKRSAGTENGPIVIQGGSATTVMVYPDNKMAARQGAGFTLVLTNSKAKARLARKGNVLVAVNALKGDLTPKLRSEFNKAMDIAFEA